MLKDKLHEIMQAKQMVSVYNDDDENSFELGYILALDDKDCIMSSVSSSGKYDGYVLFKFEDIHYIMQKTKYEEKILELCSRNDTRWEEYTFEGSNLVMAMLTFARERRFVVSMVVCGSGVIDIKGFVHELEEGTCTIYTLSRCGEFDGYSIVDLSKITYIYCDSEKDSAAKFLFECNK